MRTSLLSAALLTALAAPALGGDYPVSGKWGESASSEQGAIDCAGKRVIEFQGNQRTDSKGGVPGYRNRSITSVGSSEYRVVDEFTTGQISNAQSSYTLRQVDQDRLEMQSQQGTVQLQRCK
jgi:hypothetical protein